MPQDFNTEEEDLFKSQFEDEDDDGFIANMLDENEDVIIPPGNTDEDEEEDEEEPLFNSDKDEEEEEEIDLEALNKKLGTNFESADEIKKLLKKDDAKSEDEKDDLVLKTSKANIETFNDYIEMDDERLVRQSLMAEAQQSGKNIASDNVKDEVEAKITALKDSETLKTHASAIRSSLKTYVKENEDKVKGIEKKRQEREESLKKSNSEQLQNAFAGIFKEKQFYGIEVSKEQIQSAYKKVTDGSLFAKINADQGMIARLAMFLELETEIEKKATAPTHSEGIKRVIDQIDQGNSKNRSVADNSHASRNSAASSLINSMLQ